MQAIEKIDKDIALLNEMKESLLLKMKKQEEFITRGEVEELIKNLKEELAVTYSKGVKNDNGSSKLTFSSFDNTYTIDNNTTRHPSQQ